MFAALTLERDPLTLVNLPDLAVGWLQVVGFFAALGLFLWLIVRLAGPSRAELFRFGSWRALVVLAAVVIVPLAYAAAGIGYLFRDPDAEPTGRVEFWGWCLLAGGVAALVAVCLPFLHNLFAVRPRRVWALAKLSFKEAIRRRVLYAFSFLLLVFLFASWFLPHKPEDQVRSYVQAVYWAMTPLLLLTAVLLAAFSIPQDIRHQTIHTILTKPVERFEVVLGRFLGFAGLMTLVLVVMTAVSLGYVVRGVDPAAAAESLKARVPVYAELTFENTGDRTRAINVGREWDYRSYISGPLPGKLPQTAVYTFASLPSGLADRKQVRAEFAFDIYRTTKGKEARGVSCGLAFRTRNFAEGNDQKYKEEKHLHPNDRAIDDQLAEKYGYWEDPGVDVIDFHTQSLDLPGGLFRNALKADSKAARQRPALEARIHCNSVTQYVGMAKYDFYLREDDVAGGAEKGLFALNFFKGAVGLWLRLCLVIGLAVALSTYLSGVITLLVAVMIYFGGSSLEFIHSVAQGKNVGGGPLEATVRLANRDMGAAPLPDSPVASIAVQIDEAFRVGIRGVMKLLPDVDRLDFTSYVAEGFNIGAGQLLLNLLLVAAYLLPWAILGYYLIKWREVASSN